MFGAIRTQSGSSSNYWLFTGEQRDSDSAFYYSRARHYDPSIGRFVSQDPIPPPNRYAYVRNNPVRYVDPYGLLKLSDLGHIRWRARCDSNPRVPDQRSAAPRGHQ